MYPNLFKKYEQIEKYSDQSKTDNISSSTSSSSAQSSEGTKKLKMPISIREVTRFHWISVSLVTEEFVQETKTSTASKVTNNVSNSKPSFNLPSSPARSLDSAGLKPPGIYAKKLPERLQRLQDEKKCPELSVKTFFDFMRTAYQVNDSFEELATTLSAKSEIDWTKLAKTDLISQTTDKSDSNDTIKNDKCIVTPEAKDNESGSLHAEKAPGTEEQETSSNVNSQVKHRRLSLRKLHSNSQKPTTHVTSGSEDQPPPAEDSLDKEREDSQLEKTETAEYHLSQISAKKSKIFTAETFSEHKEQLLAKIMKRKLGDILHEGVLDSVLPYMLPKPVFSQPVIKKSITNPDAKKNPASAVNVDSRSTPSIHKDKEKDKHKYRRKSFE